MALVVLVLTGPGVARLRTSPVYLAGTTSVSL
jgi:hypothetical protein